MVGKYVPTTTNNNIPILIPQMRSKQDEMYADLTRTFVGQRDCFQQTHDLKGKLFIEGLQEEKMTTKFQETKQNEALDYRNTQKNKKLRDY